MARINIEDSLFKEVGFTELAIKLGSRRTALGALVEAYMLAQEHFLSTINNRLIPFDEWKRNKIADEIIECGLAQVEPSGVYVRGSEKHFAWLLQRSEAGKTSSRNKAIARSTVVERSLTVEQPLTLTPTLSLTHKTKNNTIAQKSLSVFNFEILYQKYPRKMGKAAGFKKLKTLIKTEQDYQSLSMAIDNYVSYLKKNATEAQYIKHFSTFITSWKDWLDEDVGTATAMKQERDWSFLKD